MAGPNRGTVDLKQQEIGPAAVYGNPGVFSKFRTLRRIYVLADDHRES
jgi:hypothetical protein